MANMYVMFVTATGGVRRNALSDFTNIKANGKIAMKLDEGDRLISVKTCADENDIVLATRLGKCIRFSVEEVPSSKAAPQRVYEASSWLRVMRLSP